VTTADLPVHRRTVLRGLGLAALSVGTVLPVACDPPTSLPEENDVMDLSFRTVGQFRPFELVAPGFEQAEEPAAVALGSVRRTDQSPPAPFAAVELTVVALDDSGISAGLHTAAGDQVVGAYDPRSRRASIEVRRAGRTTVVTRRKVRLAAPFRFAFAVCENQVTVLADTGDGWTALCTDRDRVAGLVDLRSATVLAAHTFGWGPRRPGGQVRVSDVRAGCFGMAGLRDLHLVQHPDGRAYVRDGRAYLTATCAGLGFFQQAHWGVFTIDLERPDRLEQVGQLFFTRDDLVLGDHAGQVIVDEEEGTYVVATSSWGDFDFNGIHVRHTTTRDDVLHGLHVLATEPLDLPTAVGSWDPAMTRIDGRWHVGFVESPSQDPFDFHPALAIGPEGADHAAGLELVGADGTVSQCEGPILQEVEGQWRLMASDGLGKQYRVYDLSMKLQGVLDAPYGTNIPHPQLVPRPGGGWWMITFDGTPYAQKLLGYGTHGDVLVMASRDAT
jgi:hypothetical protein